MNENTISDDFDATSISGNSLDFLIDPENPNIRIFCPNVAMISGVTSAAMLAEIKYAKKNNIFFSIEYCAKVYGISEKTVKTLLNRLVKDGFLKKKKSFETIKDIEIHLRNKCGQKLDKEENFGHRCSWCNSQTYCLEEHHYPMPKIKGGLEVVSICSNCHREFHYLEKFYEYEVNHE